MPDTPRLDRTDFRICLNANLRAVTRAVDTVYRKHLRPFSLTESQFNLLAVLAQYRKMAQHELGKLLLMERSTVSRDLRRLLEKGYIHRSGPANRKQLQLTEAGLRLMETLVPIWEAAMAETIELLGEQAPNVLELRKQL